MKEDVLEQLVDDYLKLQGYFTRHNVKFSPRKDHPDFQKQADSVASDIDVVGFNPLREGADRVMVVSCKSWQGGFDTAKWSRDVATDTIFAGRESWKFFRELVSPKWSEAFCTTVQGLTGSTSFTYVTAVTHLKGERAPWEQHSELRRAIGGNPIRLLTLEKMFTDIQDLTTTTPAASEIGRLVQLLKSADLL